ncbi:Outer-membrane lipoprotein LolB [Candidatus Profftia lariciata]|uniref:lipoprotein insertase outer membrane protein LolB n=1 Tax=Candidatus Profftia lariciata TaxID=1987921 RepID=UPI001D009507|nr:lipoprotein insertase outer membrane protein LolB [Candidatus Profftia lariciata]UDG81767.1 Outer-membrane lipoprotein LolB [Candidatus Profftia lariciata]
MQKINSLIVIIFCCLLLTACQVIKQKNLANSKQILHWYKHQHEVQKIYKYQASGSFVYVSNQQRVYAHFFLQQSTPDRYHLLLISSLYNTIIDLNVMPGIVQLNDYRGKRYFSDSVNKMIQNITGIRIPLQHLHTWILGIPSDANNVTLDDQYRVKQFTYNKDDCSWHVQYLKYNSNTKPAVPSQLEVTQNDEHINLKIDYWKI